MKQRIVEEILFEKKGGGSRAWLGEEVKEFGLDPKLYLAVLPAECGRAGRVNANERIYPPEEAILEHERVCLESRERFVDSELEHPEAGPTWNVVARFFGGGHRVLEDGSVLFTGLFAILNTDLGQRVMVLWEAGVPIGVSSRGMARLEKHKLDESSPYTAMNLGKKGLLVWLIKDWTLETYDVVRLPSADVYVDKPSAVREAAVYLRENLIEKQQEPTMFKNWKELAEKHPDAAAALRTELSAELTTAAEGRVAQLESDRKAVTDDRDALKSKVRELEVALESKAGAVTEAEKRVTEAVARATAAEAKLVVEETRKEIAAALDEFIKGRPAGAKIRESVLADFADGFVKDVASATKRAEQLAGIAEAAKAASPAATTEGTKPSADGSVPPDPNAKKKVSEKVADLTD